MGHNWWNSICLKNSGEKRWIVKEDDCIQLMTKTGNQRINCYEAFSKHKKYSLSFFKNMDSTIY